MEIGELKQKAIEVAKRAHAPYSQFRVGCAIYTKSGNVYVGCNVENMSYGLTSCAERNAIFNAVATEGEIDLEKVVIYTDTDKPASPCGACRQVIYEFCDGDVAVHSFCANDKSIDTTIRKLLPEAFNLNEFE